MLIRLARRVRVLSPALGLAVVLAVCAVGCGSSADSSTTATSPGTTFAYTLNATYFTGTLSPGSSNYYAFSVNPSALISLALVNLQDGSNNVLPTSLKLVLGVPIAGDTINCTSMVTLSTPVTLTNPISTGLAVGNYCITLSDAGSLPLPANFAVRITSVLGASSAITTTTNDTFTTFLQPGATAIRTVNVATRGTIAVTLTNSGTPPLSMGLAVGTWDGTICRVTKTINTAPGSSPQISITADPGTYCVQVSDIGNIKTDHITFAATISHT